MSEELKTAFREIADKANAMRSARSSAEQTLKRVASNIVGRRVEHGLGNLKGLYEITDVDLEFDGEVTAHGHKVTAGDKLGSQRWDLGRISLGRLGL